MDAQRNSDFDRLEELVSAKFNGSLDSDGFLVLHDLLSKSDELRSAYWDMVAIHVDLYWVIAGKEVSEGETKGLFPAKHAGSAVSKLASPAAGRPRARNSWRAPAIAVGLLAILLSGWSIWASRHDKPARGDDPAAQVAENNPTRTDEESGSENNTARIATDGASQGGARLTALAADSQWNFGRPGDVNPEYFEFGDTVSVDQGAVRMQLEGDTYGILQAPAVLQLITANRVRLLRGQIRVNAPEQEQGFTVETPSAEVVDIGTVFSVEAAESGTDLVVFGGRVDLNIPTNDATNAPDRVKTMHFATGEAVHVDRNGTVSRIMSVQSAADPMSPDAFARPPLIASVSDNNVRELYWMFYEIVVEGMQEDAPAFVDRFHEWNGETPSGMPSYLVGGDYVKMFNDDKVAEGLAVEVTLARPAALYVLLDCRVSPPEWLSTSFTDTGDIIGVDESPHDTANRFPANKDFAQVGAGESIDETHSIWKKLMPQGGTVTLGPNGDLPERDNDVTRVRFIQANMYGIVAVPLEKTE